MFTFKRIPIRPGTDPHEAVRFCDERGFLFLTMHETEDLLQYVFDTGVGQVHVMWDHRIRKHHLVLIGGYIEMFAREIYEHSRSPDSTLAVLTDEEALELATRLEQPGDIYSAVLITNDTVDERVLRCYEAAFRSPKADVRAFAAASCSYFVNWEQPIRPLLTRLQQDDPDERVRVIAGAVLETLDANDWNRGDQVLTPQDVQA